MNETDGNIEWDEIEVPEEPVTTEEAEEILAGEPPRIPWGKFIATVVESSLRQIDFKAYSCIGVRISLRANQWIEVEGVPATEEQQEELRGLIQYDDIALYSPAEKEGMAKHRKAVALQMGLIQPGETITKEMWQKDILGKSVCVETEQNTYINKKGKEVEGFPNVCFFEGYSPVQDDYVSRATGEWDDI